MPEQTKKAFIIHVPWYLKILFFFQRKKCLGLENGLVVWYNSYNGKLYLTEVLRGHKG